MKAIVAPESLLNRILSGQHPREAYDRSAVVSNPDIGLLWKTVDWAQEQADRQTRRWKQNSWIDGMVSLNTMEVNMCHTSCCVAGQIALSSPTTVPVCYPSGELMPWVFDTETDEFISMPLYAQQQLGLDHLDAMELFHGTNSVSYLRETAERITNEAIHRWYPEADTAS